MLGEEGPNKNIKNKRGLEIRVSLGAGDSRHQSSVSLKKVKWAQR